MRHLRVVRERCTLLNNAVPRQAGRQAGRSLMPPVSASRGQGLALEKAAAVGDLTQRALRTRTRTRDVQDALFPYMSHSLMLPVSADNASLDE